MYQRTRSKRESWDGTRLPSWDNTDGYMRTAPPHTDYASSYDMNVALACQYMEDIPLSGCGGDHTTCPLNHTPLTTQRSCQAPIHTWYGLGMINCFTGACMLPTLGRRDMLLRPSWLDDNTDQFVR